MSAQRWFFKNIQFLVTTWLQSRRHDSKQKNNNEVVAKREFSSVRSIDGILLKENYLQIEKWLGETFNKNNVWWKKRILFLPEIYSIVQSEWVFPAITSERELENRFVFSCQV